MGFFQDLKEDLSQAVNELLPEEELVVNEAAMDEELVEDTDVDAAMKEVEAVLKAEFGGADQNNLAEGLQEQSNMAAVEKNDEIEMAVEIATRSDEEDEPIMVNDVLDQIAANEAMESASDTLVNDNVIRQMQEALEKSEAMEENTSLPIVETPIVETPIVETPIEETPIVEMPVEEAKVAEMKAVESPVVEVPVVEAPVVETKLVETPVVETMAAEVPVVNAQEEIPATENNVSKAVQSESKSMKPKMNLSDVAASDEEAVITSFMEITGDIVSRGSVTVEGCVRGDIEVLGKLNVTGKLEGDAKAAEVFASNAKIVGNIYADGTVKIGADTVVIGNLQCSSAVIAGAIKGEIDVHGPVVLDSCAIVMGNIKSKSVQINNGATIEGMCSQCYAENSPIAFFEGLTRK